MVISSENFVFIKSLCSTYADQRNGILALEFSQLITSIVMFPDEVSPLVRPIFFGQNVDLTSGLHCIK